MNRSPRNCNDFLSHGTNVRMIEPLTVVMRGARTCPIPWLPNMYWAGCRNALVSNQRSKERSSAGRFGSRRMSARSAPARVWMAWMVQDVGAVLFFLLFLRSRYLPRSLAWFGIVTSALFVPVVFVMFVFPERSNPMKLCGLPAFLAEVATALWLLIKGLRPRATTEAGGEVR